MILPLAVSVEHRLVTDGRTDTRRQRIPALASVARVKTVIMHDQGSSRCEKLHPGLFRFFVISLASAYCCIVLHVYLFFFYIFLSLFYL